MFSFKRYVVFSMLVSYAITFVIMKYLYAIPPLPEIDETAWWGIGDPRYEGYNEIRNFTVNVPESVLEDLRMRLENAVAFQDPLEGIQQQYGINTHHLRNISNFWLDKYNWKEREKIINKFPQFTVRVQGLEIHYLHVKPDESKAKNMQILPLLLLHGWPSSVREFYDLIPILVTPQIGKNIVFEVIAPSLPGFAFSEATTKPGLGPVEMAVIFKNLMLRLGFDEFYAQGGDWGGNIVQIMATIYPQYISGMHSNFCFVNSGLAYIKMMIGTVFPSLIVDLVDNRNLMYPLGKKALNLLKELGYMHIQATKPDTIGVALRDSPIGLAAYMLEKYPLWTNLSWVDLDDGGLTKKFKLEDLLDNVMIYWITGSITTSMRVYAEAFSFKYLNMKLESIPTYVPSGCARFSNELIYQPKTVLKDKFRKLMHLSDLEGGHFAPAEVPQVLANDIFTFVQKAEDWYSSFRHKTKF